MNSWQRFSRPDPPERGAFPLDLNGECQSLVKLYLTCVKEAKGDNTKCKSLAKNYLKCRMDHNLMTKDEFKNLGFHDDDGEDNQATQPTKTAGGSAAKAT
ncbi:hypothetical protein BC832DRAFT_529365 [Gaertneriomyces semiglobifer]|nr:hypothetical protein BC832DRAFT_529365 [Gaertneriomyces semiglobifer]